MANETQAAKQKDKQMWNNLGKFLAVIITLIYIVNITNNIWGYIPLGSVWLNIMVYAMYYGPMVLILVVTFEAVADKTILTRVLFILFWAAIICFSISPNLWGLIG